MYRAIRAISVLFGDRSIGQFAKNREAVRLALADFDQHEDPDAEDGDFEELRKRHVHAEMGRAVGAGAR